MFLRNISIVTLTVSLFALSAGASDRSPEEKLREAIGLYAGVEADFVKVEPRETGFLVTLDIQSYVNSIRSIKPEMEAKSSNSTIAFNLRSLGDGKWAFESNVPLALHLDFLPVASLDLTSSGVRIDGVFDEKAQIIPNHKISADNLEILIGTQPGTSAKPGKARLNIGNMRLERSVAAVPDERSDVRLKMELAGFEMNQTDMSGVVAHWLPKRLKAGRATGTLSIKNLEQGAFLNLIMDVISFSTYSAMIKNEYDFAPWREFFVKALSPFEKFEASSNFTDAAIETLEGIASASESTYGIQADFASPEMIAKHKISATGLNSGIDDIAEFEPKSTSLDFVTKGIMPVDFLASGVFGIVPALCDLRADSVGTEKNQRQRIEINNYLANGKDYSVRAFGKVLDPFCDTSAIDFGIWLAGGERIIPALKNSENLATQVAGILVESLSSIAEKKEDQSIYWKVSSDGGQSVTINGKEYSLDDILPFQ